MRTESATATVSETETALVITDFWSFVAAVLEVVKEDPKNAALRAGAAARVARGAPPALLLSQQNQHSQSHNDQHLLLIRSFTNHKK